ncbi:MAG: putative acyl-CoA thioester hydrolase [Chlamydiae bacterium]|nr:putative acyl-CoA thioester hydrolase [Chlamydiota bacterium]
MQGKEVSESAVDNHTYKIFPNDLNAYGTAFGGMIMSIIDRIALVVAERHSGQTCVTASVDSIHFLNPAKRGDILLFSAGINRAWRTSMEIGIKVVAENYRTKKKRHILSAYFTFVAMDEEQKPIEVPSVLATTPEEERRYLEAEYRRSQRKKMARELKRRREVSDSSDK